MSRCSYGMKSLLAAAVLLVGCATSTAVVKPAEEKKVWAPAPLSCADANVEIAAGAPAPGAMVEKVCLVGASEDSYLRLHEIVAPREGSPLDADAVRSDIDALFGQGQLKDVVVVAQPLESKGIVLTFLVTEYEWISKVDFTGVSAMKVDDFTALAHAGVRASPVVLKTLNDTVKALYAGLGYPQAKIASSVKSLGKGNAALLLEVVEGPQVKVSAVLFEGVKQVKEPELRKSLTLITGAPYLAEVAERDVLALTAIYFDHGMINVAITPDLRAKSATELEVVFQVKEGEVYRMGKVTLTGFSVGDETEVLKGIEAKPKSVFSRSVLQRDLERVRARAKQRGYTVDITPLTTVDPGKKIIDVAFELEKKPSSSIQF